MTLYAVSSDGTLAAFAFDAAELEGLAPSEAQGVYLRKFGYVAEQNAVNGSGSGSMDGSGRMTPPPSPSPDPAEYKRSILENERAAQQASSREQSLGGGSQHNLAGSSQQNLGGSSQQNLGGSSQQNLGGSSQRSTSIIGGLQGERVNVLVPKKKNKKTGVVSFVGGGVAGVPSAAPPSRSGAGSERRSSLNHTTASSMPRTASGMQRTSSGSAMKKDTNTSGTVGETTFGFSHTHTTTTHTASRGYHHPVPMSMDVDVDYPLSSQSMSASAPRRPSPIDVDAPSFATLDTGSTRGKRKADMLGDENGGRAVRARTKGGDRKRGEVVREVRVIEEPKRSRVAPKSKGKEKEVEAEVEDDVGEDVDRDDDEEDDEDDEDEEEEEDYEDEAGGAVGGGGINLPVPPVLTFLRAESIDGGANDGVVEGTNPEGPEGGQFASSLPTPFKPRS